LLAGLEAHAESGMSVSWVVRISDDGNYAYVGCDIDDVCEVIDLTSLTHSMTIVNFPVWLSSFGEFPCQRELCFCMG
jgi:hypothetical protein